MATIAIDFDVLEAPTNLHGTEAVIDDKVVRNQLGRGNEPSRHGDPASPAEYGLECVSRLLKLKRFNDRHCKRSEATQAILNQTLAGLVAALLAMNTVRPRFYIDLNNFRLIMKAADLRTAVLRRAEWAGF